jgi:hypothetical protein
MIHITKKELKLIHNQLKMSAKKRGIYFDLNMVDLYNISIPITCPILGLPIYFNTGSVQDNSISFDRIDNSKGYSIDNLHIISYRANRLKSDATLEELRQIYEYFKDS